MKEKVEGKGKVAEKLRKKRVEAQLLRGAKSGLDYEGVNGKSWWVGGFLGLKV